jgi:hypothetical protein
LGIVLGFGIEHVVDEFHKFGAPMSLIPPRSVAEGQQKHNGRNASGNPELSGEANVFCRIIADLEVKVFL